MQESSYNHELINRISPMFYRKYEVLFLDDIEIIERACDIHVDLQPRGLKIQEQDILIAATAIARGLTLVSNDSDLLRVQGINLENWVLISEI